MDATNPKKKKRDRPGQPPKLEQISIDKICEIMLTASKRGSFFQQLPAEIWLQTGVKVSMSWLEKIQDDEFLRTKSVAMAICSKYWGEMMAQAAIPSACWIFIAKNVMKWTDNKEIKIEAQVDQTVDKISDAERKARIERIKRMAKLGEGAA